MREQLLRNIEELIPVLRRYAWFLARDPDNANDLVHHCLERAVAPLDQFQVGTNLRAWLLAIMRNCFLDGKRREKGRTEVGLDDLAGDKVWSPPRQEHDLVVEELSGVFLELPDSQKLAIIFVVFEGFSYDEAAELMEVLGGYDQVACGSRPRGVAPGDRRGAASTVCLRVQSMHPQNRTVVEVRVIDEADLVAFAAGELDLQTTEAIEAYLLHHPRAASRVEAYRDAIEAQRKRRRLM